MKSMSIAAAIALAAVQADAHAYEAIASVVSAVPFTEQVNHPTQQCWTETQQVTRAAPPEHNYLGAVIGGVAGGLLGAQIGHGNGRVAGAAVGAGVGAVTGDVIANQNRPENMVTTTQPVQRCRQVDSYQAVTTGYTVVFEYDGQRFSTRLPYNPGSQLRVNVAVTPK
ncbi:MAG TPA: glycine zipper 2TM domain-containing protein [Burkholderiales bacterium]|nr:glycine zipper 2TM domain-containing protein [Burkholderiales bacterium]